MAKPGERTDIEGKIESIGGRIVRGKLAKQNKEVKLYSVNKVVTVLASSLASAGVSHPIIVAITDSAQTPTLTAAFNQFTGLPLWLSVLGAGLFLLVVAMRRFYQSGEIEKRAIQSLAAFESFIRLDAQLAGALEVSEPLSQLSSLHEASITLGVNYADVLPESKTCKEAIRQYCKDVIDEKCKHWDSAMPPRERR